MTLPADYAREALAAYEALAAHDAEQAQAAKAVPAGFKLVPVEPTLEMLTAAGREDDKAFIDGMPHGATAADTWAAMLAAAPTPPAPEAQQTAGQEQDERDAFEAWATEYSTIPLERDDDDGLGTTGYTVMEQTMLWDAWQAAMAHAREAVESVPVPRIWGIANSRHAWIIAQAFDDYRAAVLRALVETK